MAPGLPSIRLTQGTLGRTQGPFLRCSRGKNFVLAKSKRVDVLDHRSRSKQCGLMSFVTFILWFQANFVLKICTRSNITARIELFTKCHEEVTHFSVLLTLLCSQLLGIIFGPWVSAIFPNLGTIEV